MSIFSKFVSWLTAPAPAREAVQEAAVRIEPTLFPVEVSPDVSAIYVDLPESPYDPVEVIPEPVKKERKPRAPKAVVKTAPAKKVAAKTAAKKTPAKKTPVKKTTR